MGLYAQFQYTSGTEPGHGDTYGARIRGDIPISIVNNGYTSVSGALHAKVQISVGPFPSNFRAGSKVIAIASNTYYPGTPEQSGLSINGILQSSETLPDNVLFAGYVNDGVSTATFDPFGERWDDYWVEAGTQRLIYPGWSKVFFEDALFPIEPKSVLYIRVYVTEPYLGEEGLSYVLPWDIRGSAWATMSGDFGSTHAAWLSLPVTHYTGGDVHAPIPMDIGNTREPSIATGITGSLMAALGFLADTIQTDGALIVDSTDMIHPNMVMPLLRSFGISELETAALKDKYIASRTKNFLKSYRSFQIAKGRGTTVEGYAKALTGYDIEMGGMENLLMTQQDAAPYDPVKVDFSGHVFESGLMVSKASLGRISTAAGMENQYADEYEATDWSNSWEDVWTEDHDVWNDGWTGWDDLVSDLTRTSSVITSPLEGMTYWLSDDIYDQRVDWCWTVRPNWLPGDTSSSAWIGSYQNTDTEVATGLADQWKYLQPLYRHAGEGPFNYSYNDAFHPGIETGDMGLCRFRARIILLQGGVSEEVTASLVFVDADGVTLTTAAAPVTAVVNSSTYTTVETSIQAPEDAAYIGWRISFPTSANDRVFAIGAPELRDFGVRDSLTRLSDDIYRNPRSVVLAIHSGYTAGGTTSGTEMDDDAALYDDGSALMSAASYEASVTLSAANAVAFDKVRRLVGDYLPHSVTLRLVTGADAEYAYLFPDRALVASP